MGPLPEENVVQLTDSVPESESLGTLVAFEVAASDTVGVSDAIHLVVAGSEHLTDLVTVSDAVGVLLQRRVALTTDILVFDSVGGTYVYHVPLTSDVPVSDAVSFATRDIQNVFDAVSVSDALGVGSVLTLPLADQVQILESLSVGSTGIVANNTTLTVFFSIEARIDYTPNLQNYFLTATAPAFSVDLLGQAPILTVLGSGANASVFTQVDVEAGDSSTIYVVEIPTVDFTISAAKYVFLNSPTNYVSYLRIVRVLSPTMVQVDKPILPDPLNGSVLWQLTTGVQGLTFETTKFTNGGTYTFLVTGLLSIPGAPFDFSSFCVATAPQPRVISAESLDDGQILVTFDSSMLVDQDLANPAEYQLLGPGSPYVESVATVNSTQVVLFTRNIQGGSYSLVVGTHTPHDSAGNPIDPFFDTVAFTTSPPINSRSIFTDYGPISRPPLTIETGVGVTFVDFQTVTLVGAVFPANYAGFQLKLSGTALNNGSYIILVVKTQNTVKVIASFNLPDSGGPVATWAVVNPRDGEIADDPAHVSVTINGTPVIPEEVIGLLGQIVLPSVPAHDQNVLVNYSWVLNPTVEIRRLNSKEFRLNDWNRDLGYLPGGSHYRYNNVLPVDTNFTSPPPIQQGNKASIITSSQVFLADGNALVDYAGLNLVLTAGINAGAYDIVSVPGLQPPERLGDVESG
jgi:hypothetical protein